MREALHAGGVLRDLCHPDCSECQGAHVAKGLRERGARRNVAPGSPTRGTPTWGGLPAGDADRTARQWIVGRARAWPEGRRACDRALSSCIATAGPRRHVELGPG